MTTQTYTASAAANASAQLGRKKKTDYLVDIRDYPETLMQDPDSDVASDNKGVPVQHIELHSLLPSVPTKSDGQPAYKPFPEIVLRNLKAASNRPPMSGMIKKHYSHARNATIKTLLTVDDCAVEFKAFDLWAAAGGTDVIANIVRDMAWAGFGVYSVIPLDATMEVINLSDNLHSQAVKTAEALSPSVFVVNGDDSSSTKGKRKAQATKPGRKRTNLDALRYLADRAEESFGYQIQHQDIMTLRIEYLVESATSTWKFRVTDKITSAVLPNARVIAPRDLFMLKGDGTLLIRSPMVNAWEEIYQLFGDNRFLSKNMRDGTQVSLAVQSTAAVPTVQGLSGEHFGGVPMMPRDTSDMQQDFQKATLDNGYDLISQSFKAYLGLITELKAAIGRNEVAEPEPGWSSRPVEIPKMYANPPFVAPLGRQVVVLPTGGEPKLGPGVVTEITNKILIAFGVIRSELMDPVSMGSTSLGQLDEHREAVTQDQRVELNGFIRLIVAHMNWDISANMVKDALEDDGRGVAEFARKLRVARRLERRKEKMGNEEGNEDGSFSPPADITRDLRPLKPKKRVIKLNPLVARLGKLFGAEDEQKAKKKEKKRKPAWSLWNMELSDTTLFGPFATDPEPGDSTDEDTDADDDEIDSQFWISYLGSKTSLSVLLTGNMSKGNRDDLRQFFLDTHMLPGGFPVAEYMKIMGPLLGLEEETMLIMKENEKEAAKYATQMQQQQQQGQVQGQDPMGGQHKAVAGSSSMDQARAVDKGRSSTSSKGAVDKSKVADIEEKDAKKAEAKDPKGSSDSKKRNDDDMDEDEKKSTKNDEEPKKGVKKDAEDKKTEKKKTSAKESDDKEDEDKTPKKSAKKDEEKEEDKNSNKDDDETDEKKPAKKDDKKSSDKDEDKKDAKKGNDEEDDKDEKKTAKTKKDKEDDEEKTSSKKPDEKDDKEDKQKKADKEDEDDEDEDEDKSSAKSKKQKRKADGKDDARETKKAKGREK